MRSRIPPWPGSMVPESLTPAPRLMADSRRSPTWAAMLRTTARMQGLPERLGDVEDGVAAGGELVADEDQQGGGEDAAEDGGDGAFPGLAGAETRGELVVPEAATDVEGGDVSCPDADHEEEDEGDAVLLLPEERDEGERVDDVDEAEDAFGGAGEDAIERGRLGAEAVPGEEDDGEGAEEGELGFEGPVGQGGEEEEDGADGHPPGGDAALVGGEAGVVG